MRETMGLPFDIWMSIHGIIMFTSWGILAPSGVFVARYMRERLEFRGGWFPYHRAFMLSTVIGSSIGSLISFLACESHFNKPHKIIAPALNSLLIIQMIGGPIAHAKRDPTRTVRPVLNQMHRIFGATTMMLGWTNICFGVYDHPTWYAGFKWTGIIIYFLTVLLVFGRSEMLLWRRYRDQQSSTE